MLDTTTIVAYERTQTTKTQHSPDPEIKALSNSFAKQWIYRTHTHTCNWLFALFNRVVLVLFCTVVTMNPLSVTRAEIDKVMLKIGGTAMRPRLRVVGLTSPPWGVYAKDTHDTCIDDGDIKVV